MLATPIIDSRGEAYLCFINDDHTSCRAILKEQRTMPAQAYTSKELQLLPLKIPTTFTQLIATGIETNEEGVMRAIHD